MSERTKNVYLSPSGETLFVEQDDATWKQYFRADVVKELETRVSQTNAIYLGRFRDWYKSFCAQHGISEETSKELETEFIRMFGSLPKTGENLIIKILP